MTEQELPYAYRRMLYNPKIQALIRKDYEERMKRLPWWRRKKRRELTDTYQKLLKP